MVQLRDKQPTYTHEPLGGGGGVGTRFTVENRTQNSQ